MSLIKEDSSAAQLWLSYRPMIRTNIGRCFELYYLVAPRRDKSCGRVADKFGLRTWI